MIIQHNIMALNAHRQLGGNNGQVSKNLEKLSSGYRINRAGDDAAGLAISEKMRSQIKGLERAQANAQDGISLVQTAEGALTEVHSMLNRLVELGTESANGTIQASDRQKIQDEVDALTSEIDRISKATNFNGIKLLDGSLDNAVQGTGAGNGQKAVLVDGGTYSNVQATKDTFTATTAAGAVGVAAADLDVTVNYLDDKGNAQQMVVKVSAVAAGNAAAVGTALVAGLNADARFKELFTAKDQATPDGKLTIESNTAGSTGPRVTSFAIAKNASDAGTGTYTASGSGANTGTAGADAYGQTVLAGGDVAAGKTITIGDKTYEFAANATDAIKDGNIRVLVGANADAAGANLQTALRANGVSSATYTAGDDTLRFTDLSQISVEQKGVSIGSNSSGVYINNTAATKGIYSQFIDTVSAAAGTKTFTVKYMLDGKEQTAQVDYTSDTNADTNRANIAAALNNNDALKGLFDIKDNGTDSIVFTAKNTGSEGAVVTSTATSDTAAGMVGGLTTTAAKDAGKTLQFENDDIKTGDTFSVGGKTYEFVSDLNKEPKGSGNIAVVKGASDADTLKAVAALLKADGIEFTSDGTKLSFKDGATQPNKGLTLQIGDTAEEFNKVTVSVADMSSKGLGINGIKVTDEGLSADTITDVNKAVELVSTARGKMGALQNRLEHTINNLGVTTENMTAAESRIRDVDMAKEMMHFTKNNVLTQAAQAMLAQANQQPQQVLQLLR